MSSSELPSSCSENQDITVAPRRGHLREIEVWGQDGRDVVRALVATRQEEEEEG